MFAVFVAAVVAVTALFHWYLWLRLVRDPNWPKGVRTALTALIILAAVGLPAGIIAARNVPRAVGEWIATVSYTWMGTAFILLLVLLAGDLFRALTVLWAKLAGSGEPSDPARREVLARGFAAAASTATVALSGASLRSGLADVQVPEVEVKMPRLPAALSGLTIAQLSDVHVGPLLGTRFVQSIVEKTNSLKPDLVVITGDLVDGSIHQLREHTEYLGKLRSRYGTYFVTGNHEYYSGVEEWLEELRRLGIRVLRNERVTIGDAASIDLAGVDDFTAGRFGDGHGPDLKRALLGRDPERELVLLAHQPREILAASEHRVGLQLSGHTHGGQIWPFRHAVGLVQPYVEGLNRHNETTQIYVSRGTGFWGPPMRLAAPAEITKLVLTV